MTRKELLARGYHIRATYAGWQIEVTLKDSRESIYVGSGYTDNAEKLSSRSRARHTKANLLKAKRRAMADVVFRMCTT